MHAAPPPQEPGFASGSTQFPCDPVSPGRHLHIELSHHSAWLHSLLQLPHRFGSTETSVHVRIWLFAQQRLLASQAVQSAMPQPNAGSFFETHISLHSF